MITPQQRRWYEQRARELMAMESELDLHGIGGLEILPGPLQVRESPGDDGAWVGIWMHVPPPEEDVDG